MAQANLIERNGKLEIVREKELKQAERAIRHQEYITVSSSFQSGLSTFLNQVFSHISHTFDMQDYVPVLLEDSHWNDDSQYLVFLALNIADALVGKVKNKYGRKKRFAKLLAEKNADILFKSAFGKSDKSIIFIIDNFHVLSEKKQRQFVKEMRQLQGYRHKSTFIKRILFIIGGNLSWQSIDPDRTSPFSNAASKIFLDDFSQEQVAHYINGRFKKHGCRILKIAAERIYELTRGHPYLADVLCKMVLAHMPFEVGCKQVEKAVEDLLSQGDRHLQNVRENICGYSAEQIIPLVSVLQGKVVRKSILQPNPMLDELILLGLLCCDKDNRVRMRNSIYSRFLRSDTTLKSRLFDNTPIAPSCMLCLPMISANKEGYCMINKLENSLRNLVVTRLYHSYQEAWLEKGLGNISTEPERDKYKNKAERQLDRVLLLRQKKEQAELPIDNHEDPVIGYATLKELEAIVVKNWRATFKSVIGSQDRFKVYLTILNQIRNKLAHNRKITDEEISKLKEIELSFKGCLGSPV